MAVDFTADQQEIEFDTNITLTGGHTMMAWYYADSYGFGDAIYPKILMQLFDASNNAFMIGFLQSASKMLYLTYDAGAAELATWTFAPTLTAWTHIAVTYDPSSAANDPIVYINGSAVAITETGTPTVSHAFSPVTKVGFSGNLANSGMDGRIADARVYNRILSATEIADIYATKSLKSSEYGLVFHPNMLRADGLQEFGGATLGATTYFWDEVSGAKGTVTGAPVGVADTILN